MTGCAEHRASSDFFIGMTRDPIANMRTRVEMCRRLAANSTDARTANILRQMADEGEADIKRLEAERQQRGGDLDEPGN